MIRNVVVGRVRDGVPAEEIERALAALRDLTVEGVEFTLVAGLDLGLRAGSASYALTCDLVDENAYRTYDADPEHNRRHGRPIAVVLSPADLESLEETIDLLSTSGALEAVREGDAEIAAGKGLSLEEIRAEFGGG